MSREALAIWNVGWVLISLPAAVVGTILLVVAENQLIEIFGTVLILMFFLALIPLNWGWRRIRVMEQSNHVFERGA